MIYCILNYFTLFYVSLGYHYLLFKGHGSNQKNILLWGKIACWLITSWSLQFKLNFGCISNLQLCHLTAVSGCSAQCLTIYWKKFILKKKKAKKMINKLATLSQKHTPHLSGMIHETSLYQWQKLKERYSRFHIKLHLNM